MGLADEAMRGRSKAAEPAGEEKQSELGIALDELFELKGKAREDAFRAAVQLCMSEGYEEK